MKKMITNMGTMWTLVNFEDGFHQMRLEKKTQKYAVS